MATIKKLEKLGFEGIDASLEISLMEYRLAWRATKKENEYEFLFSIDDDKFDTGFMTLDDFTELIADSWVNTDNLCSYTGKTVDELIADFPRSIFDLVSYYGTDNVFGTSYYPISLKEFKPTKY